MYGPLLEFNAFPTHCFLQNVPEYLTPNIHSVNSVNSDAHHIPVLGQGHAFPQYNQAIGREC